jgi:hypothetical protein
LARLGGAYHRTDLADLWRARIWRHWRAKIAKAVQKLNPAIQSVELADEAPNARRENFDAYRAALVAFLAKI